MLSNTVTLTVTANATIFVCRQDVTGIYQPVPLNVIPDSEPYYQTIELCQAACDVWNGIVKRENQ